MVEEEVGESRERRYGHESKLRRLTSEESLGLGRNAPMRVLAGLGVMSAWSAVGLTSAARYVDTSEYPALGLLEAADRGG